MKKKNKKINLLLEMSINVKIPRWVLEELIKEKKAWVKESLENNEKPQKYEKWIVDNLAKEVKNGI